MFEAKKIYNIFVLVLFLLLNVHEVVLSVNLSGSIPDNIDKKSIAVKKDFVLPEIALTTQATIKKNSLNEDFTQYAWEGNLITPSGRSFKLRIQSNNNEYFVFINDNRYKILDLKIATGNHIEFTVYTSPSAGSKLLFTGEVNNLKASGTVTDQLNKKGSWILKGFKTDKQFSYVKKKVEN